MSAQRSMKICASLLLFLVFAISAAFGQDQGHPSIDEALENLGEALQNEQGLASETRDALRNLVRALQVERTQKTHPSAKNGESTSGL